MKSTKATLLLDCSIFKKSFFKTSLVSGFQGQTIITRSNMIKEKTELYCTIDQIICLNLICINQWQ